MPEGVSKCIQGFAATSQQTLSVDERGSIMPQVEGASTESGGGVGVEAKLGHP